MNATSYLIIFTTMLVTAILSSYIVLHTATTLANTAMSETNALNTYLSCVRTSSDPLSCAPPDVNLLEVNVDAPR